MTKPRRAPRFRVERRKIGPARPPSQSASAPVVDEPAPALPGCPLAAEIERLLRDRPIRLPRELLDEAAR